MKKNILFSVFILIFLTTCASRRVFTTNYYILEYTQHSENKDIRQDKPFNYSVIVYDTDIAKTYERSKIVLRHFGPKITYSDYDIWGSKLSSTIPDLFAKRLTYNNIFTQVQRTFLDERPDYEISTKINNIEFLQSLLANEVHLNMDIFLTKAGNDEYLVKHSAKRVKIINNDKIEDFVQTINDIILEEANIFSIKIQNHFHGIKSQQEQSIIAEKLGYSFAMDSSMNENLQMGKLWLPALSQSDNEPQYKLVSKDKITYDGGPGTDLTVPVGTYKMYYGSGTESQKIVKNDIQIRSNYKTIIEPDWSCLLIDVLDERRNFAQLRYEIFDANTGESFGTQVPVEKELGEQQRVWVLKPGLYKITINNEPFNTYRDFTTILLQKGKLERLSLVVNRDDQGNPTNLIGAGIIEDLTLSDLSDHWKVFSAVHGNFNMNQNNEADKNKFETTLILNSQLENKIIYTNLPFYYRMRNLIDLGASKTTDTQPRLSADDFDIKNTLVYFVFKNFGFYSRLDMNAHFFPTQSYSTSNFNFIKNDVNGNEIERKLSTKDIRISNGLYPMIMKEGIGINYRMLNSSRAKLNLRTGFGLRQENYNNVFTLIDNNYTDPSDSLIYRVYSEMDNLDNIGTEISVVGNFNLPFNLSYTTNADVLFPFDKKENISIDWENVFNLRLLKHISIYYKLNLLNKYTDNTSYIISKHSLSLRVTYFLK